VLFNGFLEEALSEKLESVILCFLHISPPISYLLLFIGTIIKTFYLEVDTYVQLYIVSNRNISSVVPYLSPHP
jgi:hypothetical protein